MWGALGLLWWKCAYIKKQNWKDPGPQAFGFLTNSRAVQSQCITVKGQSCADLSSIQVRDMRADAAKPCIAHWKHDVQPGFDVYSSAETAKTGHQPNKSRFISFLNVLDATCCCTKSSRSWPPLNRACLSRLCWNETTLFNHLAAWIIPSLKTNQCILPNYHFSWISTTFHLRGTNTTTIAIGSPTSSNRIIFEVLPPHHDGQCRFLSSSFIQRDGKTC